MQRFVFSSSCSNYGAAGDDFLDESAAFNPVTPYAESKVWVERDWRRWPTTPSVPTFLRSATAYGVSTRLRGDLVVNNLAAYAVTTGEVLIKSDGTPWRPLVHIEDIARAFVAVLEAPRELVHNRPSTSAGPPRTTASARSPSMVAEVVPGAKVTFAAGAGPDARNYRVNCDKIARAPAGASSRSGRCGRGIEQLYDAYRAHAAHRRGVPQLAASSASSTCPAQLIEQRAARQPDLRTGAGAAGRAGDCTLA